MAEKLQEAMLEKVNKFTRREFLEDEVYCFSVILCDNEVDRDNERFSISSLKKLSEFFIGKTGIFDHNPKGANQTARIFETEVVTELDKQTTVGEPYTKLKATAYMVKTTSNGDLIKEIEGGIKKEVSVSCSVNSENCSICGANIREKSCSHKKGKSYGGVKCHTILSEPTDAYEWSFVAIPAQINAGVTKHFCGGYSINSDEIIIKESELRAIKEQALCISNECELIQSEIKSEIIKLSFLCNPEMQVSTLTMITERMSLGELIEMKKSLVKAYKGNEIIQFSSLTKKAITETDGNERFKI